ncbi:uncharacterized protein FTJAE_2289 [Fusarium tjaetaba]|uniref:Uncharacterized protein n=1 Tax=Fusarium tjaetaba TaxID=1567544 RepID=A0A8H5W5N2_9HYPO|nr:uncharacterized protein FTJAE_2289 [Fusarium tjaetaba]KAF5645859.1 hypothetical protein FTJAE_2289 [Fusarium tjaetaba]
MDFISMLKLITVRVPEPGESRMAFHFTRKPDSSIQEPKFDDVLRAYSSEVTDIVYTEFEEWLTLYVFAAGYDWATHHERMKKICDEKEIGTDWRIMRMVASTCVDNTE